MLPGRGLVCLDSGIITPMMLQIALKDNGEPTSFMTVAENNVLAFSKPVIPVGTEVRY